MSDLLEFEPLARTEAQAEANTPVLQDYDRFIVAFSGGKDSLACLLHLLNLGVSRDRIELHHHLVDGREGSTLMDWPVTEAYCEAIAKAFGIPLSFSWRVGGLEQELTRNESATAPVRIPWEGGGTTLIGGEGPLGTRNKFPQVSPDLSVRWCSPVAKIGPFAAYLNNHPKFRDGKTLVLTGERAEESRARANYKRFEPHRSDLRHGRKFQRHIDAWRPVHGWSEQQVWDIISRWKVTSHPAYYLGWGRVRASPASSAARTSGPRREKSRPSNSAGSRTMSASSRSRSTERKLWLSGPTRERPTRWIRSGLKSPTAVNSWPRCSSTLGCFRKERSANLAVPANQLDQLSP